VTPVQFQQELARLRLYTGKIDGDIGPKTKDAALRALTMGPDTPISAVDVARVAQRLRVTSAHVWTVYDVEAAGDPFIDGRPAILFEPHIFSRLTGHRYDRSHPNLSSRSWNRKLYPGSQAGRWKQLLDALALDVDAALQSASYGGFQVLGTNWKALGYKSPWDFVLSQSVSVGEQLHAFAEFVLANRLDDELRAGNWAGFARGYNGPGYAQNGYDKRLRSRYLVRFRSPASAA
jgi:hypothetical protein